jgi:hypothetical protein
MDIANSISDDVEGLDSDELEEAPSSDGPSTTLTGEESDPSVASEDEDDSS